jgi:hypothetical protein
MYYFKRRSESEFSPAPTPVKASGKLPTWYWKISELGGKPRREEF